MGEEDRTWPLVQSLLTKTPHGFSQAEYTKRSRPLAFGAKKNTANHIWLSFPAAYDDACQGKLSSRVEESIRSRVLTAVCSQLMPEYGGPALKYRGGIGVVEGNVEMWCPQPHDAFHLGPLLAILQSAIEYGDTEMEIACTHLLSAYYELWHMGASEDGQIVLPGGRFIPWAKGHPTLPPLDEHGWHHMPTGDTLSSASDAAYRLVHGLPQRDNRGRVQTVDWLLRRKSADSIVLNCLHRLLENHNVEVVMETPRLHVNIIRKNTNTGLHLKLDSAEVKRQAGNFWLTLAGVEVMAIWVAPNKHRISWKPYQEEET